MKTKAFRSLFACLIAILLMVTMIPFAAFAEDAAAAEDVADVTTVADAAEDEHAGHDHDHDEETEEEPEEKKLGVSFFVSLGVLGVLIIVGVVFAIIKREKLKIWWGSIKSELKKIVWSSPEQVKKNSIVVIVFVVALAVAIGLLDFVFFRGIAALSNLF